LALSVKLPVGCVSARFTMGGSTKAEPRQPQLPAAHALDPRRAETPRALRWHARGAAGCCVSVPAQPDGGAFGGGSGKPPVALRVGSRLREWAHGRFPASDDGKRVLPTSDGLHDHPVSPVAGLRAQ